jgi:hypothetical protein
MSAANKRFVADLLEPLTFGDFIERHWGKAPLIGRGGPERFAGLPREPDFEYLLSSLATPASGWFSIVKRHARPPDPGHLNPDGWLNLSAVYSAFRDGHSLLLNQVQRRHPDTAAACRAIEAELSRAGILLARHIGANLYLSPPDSQGFDIHYDPHDVFILQLEGTKTWRLYERRIAEPVHPPDSPFSAEEAGPVAETTVLAPGDMIYLPRGVLHDANTSDSSSLHLTLSVEPLAWRDLLLELGENDEALRTRLPAGFGTANSAPATDYLARAIAASPAAGDAIEAMRTRLLLRLDGPAPGGPSRLDGHGAMDGETVLRLGDGVFGLVVESEEGVHLHLPGTRIAASREMAETFRYLLDRPTFRACDLPIAASIEERLAFLRSLAEDGFVVVDDSPRG